LELTYGNPLGWTIGEWTRAYRNGAKPEHLLPTLVEKIRKAEKNSPSAAWIELADDSQLAAQLKGLKHLGDANDLPLYGVPFAVKDNIDAAGFTTTAACPEYAYPPAADAELVRLLREAGAIVLGKTNLDQFATGLVGTRSPYGPVANPFNADYISGGSSAGSAVAVALGYVPFALGTDTAGSGRVPAGFNHLVGLKPSKGLLSNRGVVPACRSLDCVSLFALDAADAGRVLQIVAQPDSEDAYSRRQQSSPLQHIRRLGIPDNPPWFADELQRAAYEKALIQAQALGYQLIPTDFSPLFELAALLYQGPWVAERYAAVGEFVDRDLPGLDPVVKQIISSGKTATAVDAFKAEYQRMALVRHIEQIFNDMDALLVPTAPRFPTMADVQAEPVLVNSQLGTYTNFVNLADLCAIALPSPLRSDGLPFGVTLIAPAFSEAALLSFATHWQTAMQLPSAPVLTGARDGSSITVAVVGAHLTGMPLNHQLTRRNARLLEQTRTAKKYRLYALANTVPPKPGLVRVADGGDAPGGEIIVELWRLDVAAFGSFVEEIPQPLGIGTLELCDGRFVKGFICEPQALASATDISHFGGWRAYIDHLNSGKS